MISIKREKTVEGESLLQVQVNATTWDMVAVAASVPLQKDKSRDGLGLCVSRIVSPRCNSLYILHFPLSRMYV